MITKRVKLLLGAAVFMLAVAMGSIAPSQSQAQSCSGVPAGKPVIYRCSDPNYGGAQCYNVQPDPYSAVCIDRVDPDNLCFGDTCVTGLGDQVQYIRDEVNGLDDPVFELVDWVLAEAGELGGTIQEILDQEICVAPLDPNRPVCIT